jgi:hypothetical protein
MALRRDRACSRINSAAAAANERAAQLCQRSRRPRFPRASKGVTLLRIIRFST